MLYWDPHSEVNASYTAPNTWHIRIDHARGTARQRDLVKSFVCPFSSLVRDIEVLANVGIYFFRSRMRRSGSSGLCETKVAHYHFQGFPHRRKIQPRSLSVREDIPYKNQEVDQVSVVHGDGARESVVHVRR